MDSIRHRNNFLPTLLPLLPPSGSAMGYQRTESDENFPRIWAFERCERIGKFSSVKKCLVDKLKRKWSLFTILYFYSLLKRTENGEYLLFVHHNDEQNEKQHSNNSNNALQHISDIKLKYLYGNWTFIVLPFSVSRSNCSVCIPSKMDCQAIYPHIEWICTIWKTINNNNNNNSSSSCAYQ